MRKISSLLLILLSIFVITACKSPSVAETPTTKPETTQEYTLTFSNDGMSIDLSWEQLDAVINGQHKNPTLMQEAIAKNKKYSATLIQLDLVVYNWDDMKETGIKTTLYPNVSLLTDKDITVCTRKPEAGQVTYIGDKYPSERLHQMLRLGFEHYGIQIRGIYEYGYEDNYSEDTFKLSGRVRFQDNTDKNKLHTGALEFTKTGAVLRVKYHDILEEFGLTNDDCAQNGKISIETWGVMLFTSKQEACIGTMDIISTQYANDKHADDWVLNIIYDRATENNQALLDEYAEVQQEIYAELTLGLTTATGETRTCTFFLRCDM